MLTAIISFLGSTFLRTLLGELFAKWTAHQDHAQEIERMRLQGELDAAAHARQQEAIRTQAELGVKTIEVQATADVGRIEAGGWAQVVADASKPTGVWLVDLWNGVIRPGLATWAIVMVTGNYCGWWKLDDYGWSLCGAALGIYLANRDLFKRGKQ